MPAITINGTGSNAFWAEFAHVTGLSSATGSTTAGVDVSIGATGTGTTPSSGATANTTAAGEYGYGFAGHDGQDSSVTAGGNITTVEHRTLLSAGSSFWGDNTNLANAAGFTATFTGTASARWGCIAIAYLVLSSGSGLMQQVGSLANASGGSFAFQADVPANDRIIVGIFCHNTTPTAPTAPGLTFFQNDITRTDAGGNTYTVWSGVPSFVFAGQRFVISPFERISGLQVG